MERSNVRVVAAMSGGVDSAVAAGLLRDAGCDVVGVTMKMYSQARPSQAKSCCGAEDFDDARQSAATLGIPHYVLDFEEAFHKRVVGRFVDDYRDGRTPNPCVACNNFVKLGTLRAFATRIGARFVATGHYARLVATAAGPRLYRGDAEKDQSYALAQLSREQLSGLLLPLGELSKAQTRQRAVDFGLSVHAKADSQDICFVEGGDYRSVLERERRSLEPAGAVVTTAGRVVGEHNGISGFTVGQRRGLPATHFNDGPRYVTRIDPTTNTVVIGREDELAAFELEAHEVNLIRPELFGSAEVPVRVMTRYRAPLADALATFDAANGVLRVRFRRGERAIAPGQLVAVYAPEGDEVLGAATIRAAL